MRQILKVQPLPPEMVVKISKLELAMASAQAEAAKLEAVFRKTIDNLCELYDPQYKQNCADQSSLYSAQIKDGCLVITKD